MVYHKDNTLPAPVFHSILDTDLKFNISNILHFKI